MHCKLVKGKAEMVDARSLFEWKNMTSMSSHPCGTARLACNSTPSHQLTPYQDQEKVVQFNNIRGGSRTFIITMPTFLLLLLTHTKGANKIYPFYAVLSELLATCFWWTSVAFPQASSWNAWERPKSVTISWKSKLGFVSSDLAEVCSVWNPLKPNFLFCSFVGVLV